MTRFPAYLEPLRNIDATTSTIDEWIASHAEELRERSSDHPLHQVLSHRPWSPKVVLQLLRAAPWALTVPTGQGKLPIHIALYWDGCPLDVIEAMVATRPECLASGAPTILALRIALRKSLVLWGDVDLLEYLLSKAQTKDLVAAYQLVRPNRDGGHAIASYICRKRPEALKQMTIPMDVWQSVCYGTYPHLVDSLEQVTLSFGDSFDAGYLCEGCVTPLVVAIQSRASSRVIEFIAKKNLKAVATRIPESTVFGGGGYPLHLAMRMGIDHQTIEVLANVFPAAFLARDSSGSYPLHYLGYTRSPEKILSFPEARESLRYADHEGRLPLHCMAAWPSTMELVIRAFPEACLVPDVTGGTPVHSCLALELDEMAFACFEHLVRACPQCLAVQDLDGRLPLHILMTANHRARLVAKFARRIVGEHPDSLATVDNKGDTPLHLALKPSVPIELLNALLTCTALHRALRVADACGDYPLGVALKHGVHDFAKVVLHIDPSTAELKNSCRCVDSIHKHFLELYDPIDDGVRSQTIDRLVSEFPSVPTMQGSHGRTLLHVVCARPKWFPWIKAIVRVDSSVLSVPDNSGNLPLHYFMCVARKGAEKSYRSLMIPPGLEWSFHAANKEGLTPFEVGMRTVGFAGDPSFMEAFICWQEHRLRSGAALNKDGDPVMFWIPWHLPELPYDQDILDILGHLDSSGAEYGNATTGETILHRLIRSHARDAYVAGCLRHYKARHADAGVRACGGWLPLHMHIALQSADTWKHWLPPAPVIERPSYSIEWISDTFDETDTDRPSSLPRTMRKSEVFSEAEYRLLLAYPAAAAAPLPCGAPLWFAAAVSDGALTTLYCILKEAPEVLPSSLLPESK